MAEQRPVAEGLEPEGQPTGSQMDERPCERCGRILNSEDELRAHREHCKPKMDNQEPQQSDDVGAFTCEFCASTFSSQEEMGKHQNCCSVRQRADSH